MSVNISRTVIFDGIKNGSVVGLDKYTSDAELSAVCLFRNYPEPLLYFTSVCYIIFIVIGIPGNLITICALIQQKKVRNAAAIFIINLSISDLVICSTVLPIAVCVFVNKSWTLGKTLCRIYPLLAFSLSGVTLFSIIAITINRYILIVYPHIYHRCYNKQNLIIMVTAIWTFAFAILMPTLFEVWGRFSLDPHIGFCVMIPDINNQSPKMLLIIALFFVPCTVMLLCYIHIFWVVKKVVKKSGSGTESRIVIDEREESSIDSLNFNNETTTTEIPLVLLNDEPNSDENINGTESNRMRSNKNMSKRIRKHLRSKLKQINKKQWLPTRKDKKLKTMIIIIMTCFCVCHLPMMLIKILYSELSSYPSIIFMSYILMRSTSCLNPVIYVMMSSEYREAYKSLIKTLFRKQ